MCTDPYVCLPLVLFDSKVELDAIEYEELVNILNLKQQQQHRQQKQTQAAFSPYLQNELQALQQNKKL
jgi:hypothetical protein